MTDQYAVVEADFVAQLRTLSVPYFPAVTGRAAGWQVSDNDTVVMEGGNYFVVIRPGRFVNVRRGEFNDNEWHVTATLYMRYSEYDTLWSSFRAFRAAIIDLPDTSPLRAHGVHDQQINANEDAGYLIDSQGSYTDFVVQALDITIRQRLNKKYAA